MAEIIDGWLVITPEDYCPLNFSHEWIVRPWPEDTQPHCKWCATPKPAVK